jgi:hypothetical protein
MPMCLCRRQWILAIKCPKQSKIFTLDPLEVDEPTYKEFINCLQRGTTYQSCVHHKYCYNYSY